MKTAYVNDRGGKKVNQDALLIMRAESTQGESVLAVVCDGMGGIQKGELASAVVIRAFSHWFERDFPDMLSTGFTADVLFSSWTGIMERTNRQLIDYGRRHNMEIGTTIAAILLLQGQYYIVNVGDSRVYEVTNEGIRCLTKDHSLVMREAEEGRLRPEEIEHDSRRNILLQCIGAEGNIHPDFLVGDASPTKVYLVCCDGFRHEITAKEFYDLLKPSAQTHETALQENLQRLLSMNLDRRERDNITAIGISVD